MRRSTHNGAVADCARSRNALTQACRVPRQRLRMAIVEYTRKTGRQLTYRIRADELGRYTVHLADKELLRGRDPLSAGGRNQGANKRRVAGAIAAAQRAIEELSLMDEC